MTRPCTLLSRLAWVVTSHLGGSWAVPLGVWGLCGFKEIKGLRCNLGRLGGLGGNLQGFADYKLIVAPLNYLARKIKRSSHAKPCKLPPNLPITVQTFELAWKNQGGKVFATSLMGGNTSQPFGKSKELAGKAAICLENLTIGTAKAEGGL